MKHSLLILTAIVAVSTFSGNRALATSESWTGGSGTQVWNSTSNWTGATVPGGVGTTGDNSVATFNTATPGTSVTIDSGRNLTSITFDTAAGNYTIGSAGANAGNSLQLTNNGSISIASTFTGANMTETVNAPLVIEPSSATSADGYTFANNALAGNDVLNIGGNISSATTSSGFTLNLNGSNIKAVNTISGNISNGSAASTSLVLNSPSTWLLSGNNSGMTGGTITVNGGASAFSGATLLIGSNTALGTDSVNLSFGSVSAATANFGAVGNVSVSNSFIGNSTSASAYVGTGDLTLTGTYTNVKVTNPGFYNLGTGTLTFAGTYNLSNATSSGAASIFIGSGNTVFSGSITNSGSTGTNTKFFLADSGTTTISGSYVATGSFVDDGGTLILNTSSTNTLLPTTGFQIGGVTLNLSGGTSANSPTVGATTIQMGQTTVRDTNGGSALINLGSLSQSTGGLANFATGVATTSSGNGTSGIIASFYTVGGTDWAVSNGASTAISAYTGYTAFTTGSGSSNDLLTGSGSIGTATTVQQNTLKIVSAGAGESFALASGAVYTSTGILYTGADNYSITGGTLNTTQSQFVLQQWGTGTLNISSAVADRGNNVTTFVKGGTGALALTGSNSFTGRTYITDGIVSINSDSSLGGQNTVSVASASTSSTSVTLVSAASDLVVGSSFLGSTVSAISGTSVTLAGNANQNISSSTTVGFITSTSNLAVVLNGATLSANSTFSLAETLGSQTVNRSVFLGTNGGTLDVTSGNTLTVGGVIGVSTDYTTEQSGFYNIVPVPALTKTGSGTLLLTGANTYTGGTNVTGGTLQLGNTAALGTASSANYLNVNGGTLDLAGFSLSAGPTTLASGSIINSGGTASLNSNGYDVRSGSVSAVLADSSGNSSVMTKSTSGTVTLSAANTYSGGTAVNAGTLIVTNTQGSGKSGTGSGPLTVARGATFGGTGSSIGGSGTSFAIGSSTGSGVATVLVGQTSTSDTTTTGSLILQASSTVSSTIQNANLVFNLNANTAGAGNQLNVGNTALTFNTNGVINTTLTLNIQGSNVIGPNTAYILIAGTGSTTTGLGGTPTATTGQFAGLATFVNALGQNQIVNSGTLGGLNLAFSGYASSFYGSNSYLFLVNNPNGTDDIEVEVVPEPSTWAMMLGGFFALIVWQRRKKTAARV